jgi:hypothetical protein
MPCHPGRFVRIPNLRDKARNVFAQRSRMLLQDFPFGLAMARPDGIEGEWQGVRLLKVP